MTNSHNRTMGSRSSDRNSASPNNQQNNGCYYSSRKMRVNRSPTNSAPFFSSNSISSFSPPKLGSNGGQHGSGSHSTTRYDNTFFGSGGGILRCHSVSNPVHIKYSINHNNYQNYNHHQYHSSPQQHQQYMNSMNRTSPGGLMTSSPLMLSGGSSPPNLSLFAGSKCYDAPAPSTLPKPPRHWTSCSVAIMNKSLNSNDYSHNLKQLLNVQA